MDDSSILKYLKENSPLNTHPTSPQPPPKEGEIKKSGAIHIYINV
jgi:hypothetical protein